jgi:hypothetical protein
VGAGVEPMPPLDPPHAHSMAIIETDEIQRGDIRSLLKTVLGRVLAQLP